MENIKEVDIEEGTFKYIMIQLTNKTGSKIILRGYNWAGYHADILDHMAPEFEQLELDYECLGGGRIRHDSQEKVLDVYGYSVSFGQADHELTCSILSTKYNYPKENITWRNTGY